MNYGDDFPASLSTSLNWPLFIQFDLMEEVTGSEATQTTFATWRPSHARFLYVLGNGIFIKSQPLVPHDADDKAKIRHRPFRLFRNYTKYKKCRRTSNISMFHVGAHNARTRGTELRSSVIREIVIIWRMFSSVKPNCKEVHQRRTHTPASQMQFSANLYCLCVCACVHVWLF
jgi:hypothetical protein